jgi:hypothetical protein
VADKEIDSLDLIPKDTTLEAYRFLIQVWRRLGPEGRLRVSFEASNRLHELSAAGVRRRHPSYSDDQMQLAVTKLMLGEEVFRKLLPDMEIEV